MKPEICMIACRWDERIDPTGHWLSEKLAGIRMIRPRGNVDIFSREGIPFHPPAWWLDQLPRGPFLDGEAWTARGQFELIQSILEKKHPIDTEWRQVKFCCIEPVLVVDCVRTRFGAQVQLNDVFHAINQNTCQSRAHLQSFYESIVGAGGEGVVLRHPNQPYHTGRSPYLLKVKPEIKATATVAGHVRSPGVGGSVVSLHVHFIHTAHGPAGSLVAFDLANGLTESMRANPPAIGAEIPFVYQCLSANGTPMFARLGKQNQKS